MEADLFRLMLVIAGVLLVLGIYFFGRDKNTPNIRIDHKSVNRPLVKPDPTAQRQEPSFRIQPGFTGHQTPQTQSPSVQAPETREASETAQPPVQSAVVELAQAQVQHQTEKEPAYTGPDSDLEPELEAVGAEALEALAPNGTGKHSATPFSTRITPANLRPEPIHGATSEAGPEGMQAPHSVAQPEPLQLEDDDFFDARMDETSLYQHSVDEPANGHAVAPTPDDERPCPISSPQLPESVEGAQGIGDEQALSDIHVHEEEAALENPDEARSESVEGALASETNDMASLPESLPAPLALSQAEELEVDLGLKLELPGRREQEAQTGLPQHIEERLLAPESGQAKVPEEDVGQHIESTQEAAFIHEAAPESLEERVSSQTPPERPFDEAWGERENEAELADSQVEFEGPLFDEHISEQENAAARQVTEESTLLADSPEEIPVSWQAQEPQSFEAEPEPAFETETGAISEPGQGLEPEPEPKTMASSTPGIEPGRPPVKPAQATPSPMAEPEQPRPKPLSSSISHPAPMTKKREPQFGSELTEAALGAAGRKEPWFAIAKTQSSLESQSGRRPERQEPKFQPAAEERALPLVDVDDELDPDALFDEELDNGSLPEVPPLRASTPLREPLMSPLPRDIPTMLIQLSIVARGAYLEGADILSATHELGLVASRMRIFHRVEPRSNEVIYSMASMIEPGTFPMDDMSDFATPGMTLFLQLPCAIDSLAAYGDLLNTARRLGELLNGELQDQSHNILTRQSIEYQRSEIQEHCRQVQLAMRRQQKRR